MRIAPLLKSAVEAPVLATMSAIFGLVLSAVLLLVNIGVHEMSGLDEGQVSQLVQSIVRYLPVVFGLGGFAAAFLTDAPLSAVFGTARWASPGELKKLGTSGNGLLIGRDATTGKLLRYDGPAHLLTMAPTRTGKGVGTIIPNLLKAD